MNAPNVRSVTVRLNAEVAKYIADMKMAGKVTDDAFAKVHARMRLLDRDTRAVQQSMGGLSRSTLNLDKRLEKAVTSMRQLNVETTEVTGGITQLRTDSDRLGTTLQRRGSDIDSLSGRLGILLKLFGAVGPGLIPVGAVGIAGVAGLASQLGFAAVGMASLLTASQGLGEALEAVEKARLEPTAENLLLASEAMQGLDPAAQAFVTRFQELRPVLADIRNAAAAGWFPGLTAALDELERLAPFVADLFQEIGERGGGLIAEAADELASPEWADFRRFVAEEAPDALEQLGRTVGNIAAGMAHLWQAFAPLNSDFSSWMLDASRSFEQWASSLSRTEGFQDFVDYVRTNGPKVAEMAAAVADALIQIAQAAAPLGGPVLDAITAIARAIAAIADSPLGTPIMTLVTAMSAASIATKVWNGALTALNTSLATTGRNAGTARAGLLRLGIIGGAILAIQALDNAMSGLFDTELDSSSLMRNLEAIRQGSENATLDRIIDDLEIVNTEVNGLAEPIAEARNLFGLLGDTGLDKAEANIAKIDEALASMVEGGNAEQAAEIMQKIAEQRFNLVPGADVAPWAMDELLADFTEYKTALDNTAGSSDNFAGSTRASAGATALFGGALSGAAAAAALAGPSIAELTQRMEEHTAAALGAFDAETQWRRAMVAAREQAEASNAGLQGNSEEVLANRDALAGLASAWQNQSLAVRRNVERYQHARRTFIDTAVAMGATRDKARELANAFIQMPPAKPRVDTSDVDAKMARVKRALDDWGLSRRDATAALKDLASGRIKTVQDLVDKYGVTDAEARALLADLASGRLREIINLLNEVDGRHTTSSHTHTIFIQRRGGAGQHTPSDSLPVPSADGSIYENGVRTFARGGFGSGGRYYDRLPMMVRGGANILWGEQETGWEAYISGKPGMRDRNLAVLSEAAERLGVTVSDLHSVSGRHSSSAHLHRGGGASVNVSPSLSLAGAQFVLEVPGMGRLMTRVVDARIDAHDRHVATLEGR